MEMTFGQRSAGLGGKLANLEAEDYFYLGVGAFGYYYFAKEALHPSRKSSAKPEGQAAIAGAKFLSAYLFYRSLKTSGLMEGRIAAMATVAGVAGLEWYIRKDHPALPAAVGWGHHGWNHQGLDNQDWDDQDQHHHHHHHGWH
ncbi:MAG TPA: hypothetical protein VFA98_05120 [Thermoanaerobaculia bacterium]|jgi:hypothetical protein|nr:hypothetical protein [Thermoanaerobaculia bacterium]